MTIHLNHPKSRRLGRQRHLLLLRVITDDHESRSPTDTSLLLQRAVESVLEALSSLIDGDEAGSCLANAVGGHTL